MPKRVFAAEEKEKIRLAMLEAGFPLIKEYGMTHTTVSKLTEAAGIAKGTFYHFWKNKEEYMTELILYHRQKIAPLLLGEDVISGKRKICRYDAKKYLLAVVDTDVSIYPHMTLDDEAKIFKSSDIFKPDIEKDSAVTGGLIAYAENVRPDINIPLIANMSKILVITAESREELLDSVYQETIDVLIEAILNQIFEE